MLKFVRRRFKLRTILVLTVVVAAIVACLAHEWRTTQAEQKLIDDLFEAGGRSPSLQVRLASERDVDYFRAPELPYLEFCSLARGPSLPAQWLQNLLGEDAFDRIIEIKLDSGGLGFVTEKLNSLLQLLPKAQGLQVLVLESKLDDELAWAIAANKRLQYLQVFESFGGHSDEPFSQLTGAPIEEWGKIRSLRVLDLSGVRLSPQYIPSFAYSVQLQVLAFRTSQVNQLQIESLDQLKELQVLSIEVDLCDEDDLDLPSEVPPPFGQSDFVLPMLPRLKNLSFLGCFTKDTVNRSVVNQPALKRLVIESNQLTLATLKHLKDCKLEQLELRSCDIDQEEFEAICTITSLKRLDLWGSWLDVTSIAAIENLPLLGDLSLNGVGTQIDENLLHPLAKIKRLETLSLSQLIIPGSVLLGLAECKSLRVLELRSSVTYHNPPQEESPLEQFRKARPDIDIRTDRLGAF